jgi:hypothetical protein
MGGGALEALRSTFGASLVVWDMIGVSIRKYSWTSLEGGQEQVADEHTVGAHQLVTGLILRQLPESGLWTVNSCEGGPYHLKVNHRPLLAYGIVQWQGPPGDPELTE